MNFELRNMNKTYSSREREENTVRLHIEINTMCNNHCLYCYARANETTWGIMMSREYLINELYPSLKELSQSLQKEEKYLDVVLLGGEPTLHPFFSEIVSFLLEQKARISITSNGTYPYRTILSNSKIRWAYTYHPSQEKDYKLWLSKIISGKNDWWEVAVSPLIDCWGTEEEVLEKVKRVQKIISLCHEHDIKVQPTFQFNPYEKGNSHIEMENVIKYYSFLEEEYPIYLYGNKEINDYTILKEKKNYLKGCSCLNNNFQIDVKGRLTRCCSNEEISWKDLISLDKNMVCPLSECTCYGFLTLYKTF